LVTDVALARKQPELAILSVLAHGKSSRGSEIGAAALASLTELDEPQAALYHDIIEASLSAEARKELIRMAILNYRFQGPSFRRGKAEGKAEGKADMLTSLVVRKFGAIDQLTSERIERAAAKDIERWAARLLTAASMSEVFDE
jgi:ParB-like chromosome segregation protein Spo0J